MSTTPLNSATSSIPTSPILSFTSTPSQIQVLKDIYDFMTLQQSIVFVEMRRDADNVANMMRQAGFEVSTLHGELTPQDRDRVMDDFRAGRTKVIWSAVVWLLLLL